MKNKIYRLWMTALIITLIVPCLYGQKSNNPIIYADVPDISMVRVGDSYYSSTTMHINPGVPIMKSTDLVNWKIVNYACDTLADLPALNLTDGQNAYTRGPAQVVCAITSGYIT